MNYCYSKGVQQSVHCWEVVPFLEGPLLEVPLILFLSKNLTVACSKFCLNTLCVLVKSLLDFNNKSERLATCQEMLTALSCWNQKDTNKMSMGVYKLGGA